MGLITGLFTWPLAPVRGVTWVAEQIRDQADKELYDPKAIRAQLAEIEMKRELGEIDEEEAAQIEEDLLGRLLAANPEEELHG
jgi:cytochrome c-type biogenesis protein CcmI